MGIEALTQNQEGKAVVPTTSEDWLEWVSATKTRNFLLEDPILDWLDLYGKKAGFQRDDELPGYDPRTAFSEFLFERANQLEAAVIAHLGTLTDIRRITSENKEARSLEKAEKTFAAMVEGVPIIYQGVLRDAENQTYGLPDLLTRSDVLRELFPDCLTEEEASTPAPELGSSVPWHYRIVDIKFTTLHLLAGGELGNSGSAPAYKRN